MRAIVTVLVCVLLVLGEALAVELFNLDVWLPFIAVGVVVFLALKPPMIVGCAGTFVAAWCADLLSATPPGVRALSLTAIFFAVKLGGARLEMRSALVRALVVVAAALFGQVIEVLCIVLFGGAPWRLFTSLLLGGAPSALFAPIGLLIAWVALERVDRFFTTRHEKSLGTLAPR